MKKQLLFIIVFTVWFGLLKAQTPPTSLPLAPQITTLNWSIDSAVIIIYMPDRTGIGSGHSLKISPDSLFKTAIRLAGGGSLPSLPRGLIWYGNVGNVPTSNPNVIAIDTNSAHRLTIGTTTLLYFLQSGGIILNANDLSGGASHLFAPKDSSGGTLNFPLPAKNGTSGQVLTWGAGTNEYWSSLPPAWLVGGNNGLGFGANQLGSIDGMGIVFIQADTNRLQLGSDGTVGFNAANFNYTFGTPILIDGLHEGGSTDSVLCLGRRGGDYYIYYNSVSGGGGFDTSLCYNHTKIDTLLPCTGGLSIIGNGIGSLENLLTLKPLQIIPTVPAGGIFFDQSVSGNDNWEAVPNYDGNGTFVIINSGGGGGLIINNDATITLDGLASSNSYNVMGVNSSGKTDTIHIGSGLSLDQSTGTLSATGGSDTVPSLQAVTDVGNVTTNAIAINADGPGFSVNSLVSQAALTMYIEDSCSQLAFNNGSLTGGTGGYAYMSSRKLTINGLKQYLPDSSGTYVLRVNGTAPDSHGNVTVGGSSGTVTSIATTAPITGGTITSTGTIGIAQATTSTNGYLSSTDWNTFNNKVSDSAIAVTSPIVAARATGKVTLSCPTCIVTAITDSAHIAGTGINITRGAGSKVTITNTKPDTALFTTAPITITRNINGNTIGLTTPLSATFGGTGLNTSSSTGIVQVLSGTYSVTPTLANGSSATTQTAGDATGKVATDAFVTTAINNAISGINPAVAVQAATTTVLPNSPTYINGVSGVGATLTAGVTNTALVVDGYTPALNERILVKNQASAFQNGVYFVSQIASLGVAWIITRALDYDQPSDINNTGAIPVISGTVNTTTQWVITSQVTTVGTDAITYTLFSANPANNITTSTSAGGDLTGTYPNPTIKASVGLTGTPTVPTASAGTNTTQAASTAFVNTNGGAGWYIGQGTWSYSTATSPQFVISSNADETAMLTVGMKIKLTQTTTKYFIITAIGAFSGGATLITVYGGTNYTLANAAITNNFYSPVKVPFGFPMNPVLWSVLVTDVTAQTQSSPTANTWYNIGTTSEQIVVPIGSWILSYRVTTALTVGTDIPDIEVGLSTANNTQGDASFTQRVFSNSSFNFVSPASASNPVNITSTTTYYLNASTIRPAISSITFQNNGVNGEMVLRAICSYL